MWIKTRGRNIQAIIAGFLISLLGGCRIQIGGPAGAFIIIVYGILNDYGLATTRYQ